MLKDLLKETRSVRCFEGGKTVDYATLESLVELCRYTPSSANLQALKFRIVSDDAEVEKVFPSTAWAGYIKDEKLPPKGHEPAAYIIICCDKSIAPNSTPFLKDTGICAQTIVLGAREVGIGACMIGSFNEKSIKTDLCLSENLEITLVVALGYPAEYPEIVDCSGDIKYYRQEGKHFVPKRSLDEIIIK